MDLQAGPRTIDVRALAPSQRHATIFSTFSQLREGETLQLVNDHDPWPLHGQFEARLPGQFGWDYVERGPAVWRVALRKLARPHGAGNCCGGCGG